MYPSAVSLQISMHVVLLLLLLLLGSGGPDEPYRLPEHMREAVERQYRKDVERVHGEEAGRLDDEYKSFIQVRGRTACTTTLRRRAYPCSLSLSLFLES